jgi:hypothetical protein
MLHSHLNVCEDLYVYDLFVFSMLRKARDKKLYNSIISNIFLKDIRKLTKMLTAAGFGKEDLEKCLLGQFLLLSEFFYN